MYDDIVAQKPRHKTIPGFCLDIIADRVDGVPNLSAYHVGAGNEQLSQKAVPAVESVVQEKSFPPLDGDLGEGVGRESEGTPRKPPCKRAVPLPLQEHEDLIFEFWRIKGGSKSDTAWKMLMNELGKILAKYSHDKVHEQLLLAINGKWKGVTLANLSRFERGPSDGGNVTPEIHKHPAYRDFTAERLAREANQNQQGPLCI